MDYAKTLSNPVVILGGIGLGIVLMLTSKSSAVPPTSQAQGYGGISDAYNIAALNAQTANLSSWADISVAKIAQLGAAAKNQTEFDIAQMNGNVARYLGAVDNLKNISDNNMEVARQSIVSNQGITQAIIQQSGSVAVDSTLNMVRLSLGSIDAAVTANNTNKVTDAEKFVATTNANGAIQVATINSNANIKIAQEQAAAAKKAAKSNMISTLLGTVASAAIAVVNPVAGIAGLLAKGIGAVKAASAVNTVGSVLSNSVTV